MWLQRFDMISKIIIKWKKTAQNFSNVTARKNNEEELDEELNYRNEVVLEKERT